MQASVCLKVVDLLPWPEDAGHVHEASGREFAVTGHIPAKARVVTAYGIVETMQAGSANARSRRNDPVGQAVVATQHDAGRGSAPRLLTMVVSAIHEFEPLRCARSAGCGVFHCSRIWSARCGRSNSVSMARSGELVWRWCRPRLRQVVDAGFLQPLFGAPSLRSRPHFQFAQRSAVVALE